MATSKWPKCDSTTFEMKDSIPSGASHPFVFVQCSRCGAVIGVLEQQNISTLIRKLATALNIDLNT